MDNNIRKIIYSVSVCSENKYKELFLNSENKPGQQVQKYHRLLLDGLASDKDMNIEVISKLPITKDNFKKTYLKGDVERFRSIKFCYIPIFNIPVLRNFIAFIYILMNVIRLSSKKDTVIVGDVLNITTSIANLIAGKVKGIRTVGIVTDIPTLLEASNRGNTSIFTRLLSSFNDYIIQSFDSYIFLTEPMNNLINKKNKPYVVLEGHVDIDMKHTNNLPSNKYDKIVCMYTGSLKKIYGIKMLTEAFIKANIFNSELHIYGDGDFKEELIEICKKNNNVKYLGVKLNEHIVKEQLKATLLINPRPTNEEYTKYSFPSKNMEYMVSGTPTLTTKLPGMPEQYNEYVYLIEEESTEGLINALKKVLSHSREELHLKGERARQFVLKEKNNHVQASKIINMIASI